MPSQFADPRLPQRFWAKCVPEPNSGCWLWAGADSLAGEGYGKFRIGEHSLYAHRIAYETLVGVVPADLQLDHLCRTRCCVNPSHLEPVSQRENILRGDSPTAINASRTHCAAGHELAGENLVANRLRRGERRCRRCKNEQDSAWARADRRRRRRPAGA